MSGVVNIFVFEADATGISLSYKIRTDVKSKFKKNLTEQNSKIQNFTVVMWSLRQYRNDVVKSDLRYKNEFGTQNAKLE